MPPCRLIVSLKMPPCQLSLQKCLLVCWLSLWKRPSSIVSLKLTPLLIDCLSESDSLLIISPKVPPLPINRFSESESLLSAPLSIVSLKINPCWLTVYSKNVPLSIKQQRSACRKCRIWEQQKEDNSIWMKQSEFQLYTFNFKLAFVRCCQAGFFIFFIRSVVFDFQMWYLVWRQFTSRALNIFFDGIFRHGWFGMCTPSCILFMYQFKPTSRATFIKKYLWNNYG